MNSINLAYVVPKEWHFVGIHVFMRAFYQADSIFSSKGVLYYQITARIT